MEETENIEIDQIQCIECGRNMIIRADKPLLESDKTCSKCKRGLTPEWEY